MPGVTQDTAAFALGRTVAAASPRSASARPRSAACTPRSATADAGDTVAAAWDGRASATSTPRRSTGGQRRGCGWAAASHGTDRDDYVLSSKVGRLLRADAPPHPDDFDPTGRRSTRAPRPSPPCTTTAGTACCAPSRRAWPGSARTGSTSCIVHDPDDYVDEALAGAFPTLLELRDQGVVTRDRRGHEPDRCAGAIRPRVRPGPVPARRPLHAARTGRAGHVPAAVRAARHRRHRRRRFNSGLLADPDAGARYNYDCPRRRR